MSRSVHGEIDGAARRAELVEAHESPRARRAAPGRAVAVAHRPRAGPGRRPGREVVATARVHHELRAEALRGIGERVARRRRRGRAPATGEGQRSGEQRRQEGSVHGRQPATPRVRVSSVLRRTVRMAMRVGFRERLDHGKASGGPHHAPGEGEPAEGMPSTGRERGRDERACPRTRQADRDGDGGAEAMLAGEDEMRDGAGHADEREHEERNAELPHVRCDRVAATACPRAPRGRAGAPRALRPPWRARARPGARRPERRAGPRRRASGQRRRPHGASRGAPPRTTRTPLRW